MLPEVEQRRFEADLEVELRLARPLSPEDPALAADWQLKRELGMLEAPALPAGLRRRVLAGTARPARAAWPLAAAAMLAGLTVLVMLLQPWRIVPPPGPPVQISAEQLGELQVALDTLGDGGRLGLRMAGRELAFSVDRVRRAPGSLPYFDQIERVLLPERHDRQTAPDAADS
ncbi:MAG: hypothetical protein CVV18_00820 [Gammaproteobacteria bacterium HGW-Gammaproteobacteria-8]|nr:MAG: hypothetical protein CVV18_00820 [Gammaproteobacteria bacterium HGW-Gammaproteobacteria-8]